MNEQVDTEATELDGNHGKIKHPPAMNVLGAAKPRELIRKASCGT